MEENFVPDTFLLQVDNGNIPYLKEAAKWAKFLAIVGFAVCAVLLLLVIFFSSLFTSSLSEISSEAGNSSNLQNIILIIYVVVIAILYFFPLFYLYNFSTKMQTAISHNDQISLNASFRNLKSCLKYMGVLTIVVLCVYVLAMIFAVLGFAFMR